MSQNVHIQNSDLRNYADYHQDGLLDLFVGLGFVLGGAAMFSELFYLAGAYPATMLPVWQVVRKKTLARLHVGEIPERHKGGARALILGFLVAGVLMFMAGLGAYAAVRFESLPPALFEWLHRNLGLVLGGMVAAMFTATGLALKLYRFLGYAGLFLAVSLGGQALGVPVPAIVITFGALVTLAGALVLRRFLREHPA